MVTAKNLFLTYLGAATVATVAIGNVSPTIAAMDANTSSKVKPEMASDVVPQTTCKLALMAQAENAVTRSESTRLNSSHPSISRMPSSA